MIEDLFKIVLFIVFVLLSAFFSSSEVALIAITKAKVRTLFNERRPGSEALSVLKNHPDRILITILIGNTLVNIAAASIATAIAIDQFGDIGVGIATGVVTILLLVFGEIGPKTYASRHVEEYALFVSRPIYYLSKVFSPVIWGFEKAWHRITPVSESAEPSVTEEEIREWIDVGKEEGTIEREQQEMLYSVLEFGDITAREVMTRRVDVMTLEDTSTLEQSLQFFNETGFSRIPVYHENIDNIIGILNIKDAFAATLSKKKGISIKDLIYDPYFVPETKKIDELLKELQVRKVHMAIVVDEYGGFVGIVTVEDILEELVGEIQDEYDKEEPDVQTLGEGVYSVDAQMWVEDLNEELSLSLPVHESYETIGGLLTDRLGHITHLGESVEIPEAHVTLVVMQMRGRRIVRIKVVLHQGNGKPGNGACGEGEKA
jgi:CBS domain containing-hemolysin-like protein